MQCASPPHCAACRRIQLFYHQQAMIWGWYMLEPWETVVWMAFLLLLTYFVLSACFVNPSSICRQTLVAARNSLAARGARRHGALAPHAPPPLLRMLGGLRKCWLAFIA